MILPTGEIESWLREDIGHHDINNDVPGTTNGTLYAKASGVVAGITAAKRVFEYFDLTVDTKKKSGDSIAADEVALTVEGAASDMLRAERTAVNILGHASGIASLTQTAVAKAHEVNEDVRIAGTRKTTPGLRTIEKQAIAAGGGDTHRLDLSHMILIKENHIAELGMEEAITRFREKISFATKIEVEVERPEDGKRAAEAGADIVLFDNLSPSDVQKGVSQLPAGVLGEASGGITLANIGEYAGTGVDIISMGALTHSASTLDYSFRTA